MKKITQQFECSSCLLNMEAYENKSVNNRRLLQVLKFFVIVAALFLFSSAPSFAQSEGASSTHPDLKNKFLKKELREEHASTKAVENISGQTLAQFKQDFPHADEIEWSVLAGFSEVHFVIHKKAKMAFYDANNKLVGSGYYLEYSHIPQKAQNRIAKDYKGYIPAMVISFDDNENNDNNMFLFGISIVKDSYFVELKKGKDTVVIQALEDGEISYFSKF